MRDATAHSGVHAFFEHLHFKRTDEVAAQGSGAPELFVVRALGIETHHQARRAQAGSQCFDVRREVSAAAFLACFDEHYAARARDTLGIEGGNGSERSKHRVAVVRAAAPVELSITDHRLPWSEPLVPARELRLLVQMPVEQHAIVNLSGDLDEE